MKPKYLKSNIAQALNLYQHDLGTDALVNTVNKYLQTVNCNPGNKDSF
jgi:hypothetical protein